MTSYSGFNGFGQWPSHDYLINNFTHLDFHAYGINNESSEVVDFYIGWAYNIINIKSKFIIKGFIESSPNRSVTLITPIGTTFTNFSCSEKYIIFYNTTNKIVWKYCLNNEVENQWSLLPNFIDTEQCDSENSVGNGEHVQKIVCGTMINVALSSEGRLFNIPSEIPTAHIIGKIIDISCGHEHGIVLTDQGNVYTWGGGSRCQLGHGTTESLDTPELIQGLAGIKIVKISSGGWHSCAVSDIGDLYTWGWNDRGQLGIHSDNVLSEPKDLKKNSYDSLTTNFISKESCLEAGLSTKQDSSHPIFINSPNVDINQIDNHKNKPLQDIGSQKIHEEQLPSDMLECSFNEGEHSKVLFDVNDSAKDIDANSKSLKNEFTLKEGFQNEVEIRIEDNIKRKKIDISSADHNFKPLPNYAIPMLVDIYDHDSNILNLNIVDVACGSKHTLIKLEDNYIWGSGCNKYGQLGFNHESTQQVSSFKRLDVTVKDGKIYCGTWASMVKELYS